MTPTLYTALLAVVCLLGITTTALAWRTRATARTAQATAAAALGVAAASQRTLEETLTRLTTTGTTSNPPLHLVQTTAHAHQAVRVMDALRTRAGAQ